MRILIDDGASHNFLNYTLAKKLKLCQSQSTHSYKVEMIHNKDSKFLDKYVSQVPLEIQEHKMLLDFQVMHMDQADVVLGHEW